jgi:hypothetical protein
MNNKRKMKKKKFSFLLKAFKPGDKGKARNGSLLLLPVTLVAF